MKKLRTWLKPPLPWRMPVFILTGIFFGLTAFVFYVSKTVTYLGDHPETCINCHVMDPQYANWTHNSHYRVTNCNDCHVPHNNIFSKYFFKATDGLNHAVMFTLRLEPQVIIMEEETRSMIQQNCIRCHTKNVGMDYVSSIVPSFHNYLEARYCLDCHRETPHGRVNGLASTPYAFNFQKSKGVIPDWLSKQLRLKN